MQTAQLSTTPGEGFDLDQLAALLRNREKHRRKSRAPPES
jgi:hypothetical protein